MTLPLRVMVEHIHGENGTLTQIIRFHQSIQQKANR